MKRLTVLASVMVLVAGMLAFTPEAEARRRGIGIGAGIVAAAVIGGIIAASYSSRRAYAHPRRYYGPSYYSPAYAYAAPVYYRRPVYYSQPVYTYRPVRVYRSYYAPRRVIYTHRGWGGRRWR